MRKLLIVVFVISFFNCYAQDTASGKASYPQIVPPSPEATALGKYGEIPVSLFSGIPEISIPIYNLINGDITVPIGLSYHAGGIRIDDVATNVGLGWVLNAGGVITRSVVGVPDGQNDASFPGNNFSPELSPDLALNYQGSSDYDIAKDILLYNRDTERDIYYYNFLGYSGKFFIDRNWAPHFIPANPTFKIAPYNNDYVYGFIITDDKGFKYYFTIREADGNGSSECSVGYESPREFDAGWYSAWYLSQIISPDNRKVFIEYGSYIHTIDKGYSETEYKKQFPVISGCGQDISEMNRKCKKVADVDGHRITKISSPQNNIEIDFNYSSSHRLDLVYGGNNAGNYLESIKIYYDTSLRKTWDFTYGYFNQSTAPRLKLLTAKEDSKPSYQFTYNETHPLPQRLSLSQDHWGYYNGKDNSTFIPPIYSIGRISGADRNPDFDYMQSGSLTKITYPTGGSTIFEYEPHTDYVTEDTFSYQTDTITLSVSPNVGDYVTYSSSFHCEPGSVNIFWSWDLTKGNYDDFISGSIVDASDLSDYKFRENNGSETIEDIDNLKSYKLKIERSDPSDYGHITLLWTHPDTVTVSHNKIVFGGLRIKSTKDYDSLGNTAFLKYYYYNRLDNPQRSTIIPVQSDIIYNSIFERQNGINPLFPVCGYDAVSSTSVPVLGNRLDQDIGYSQVIEKFGSDSSNGRTIYKYSSGFGDLNVSVNGNANEGWAKGLLLEKINQKYNASDSTFTTIHKARNYYQSVYNEQCDEDGNHCDANQAITVNLRLNYVRRERVVPDGFSPGIPAIYPAIYEVDKYYTVSSPVYLQRTEDTTYFFPGSVLLETFSSYSYNDSTHLYPTKIITINSKGDTLKKEKKYVFDFKASPGNSPNVYDKMIARNIVFPVIEEKTVNISNSNAELFKKQTSYIKWRDTLYKPYQVLTSVHSNSLEPELTFNNYDTSGNILEYKERDGVPINIIWDYKSAYPIGKVINGDSASIAYTSFEADGKGNWTFSGPTTIHPTALTGAKGYSLAGGNITKSGLSGGTTYVVTYWKRDSSSSVTVNSGSGTLLATKNGWKLYSHEITGTTSITISGTAYIDELRLYPKGALMTTYTYTPLVGMTTQCDANNRIIYYEYDSFGRLKLIKDQDKKIVKRMDYKYQATNQQ